MMREVNIVVVSYMSNVLLIVPSIALEAATFCSCAVSAENCCWSFVIVFLNLFAV